MERKEVEEMARTMGKCKKYKNCEDCIEAYKKVLDKKAKLKDCELYCEATTLYNAGYGKVDDYKKEIFALKTTLEDREHEVRELNKKVERLEQSLSDCAFMTSSIGNLHINSIGLRRAVDEIARLQTVEAELQELNAKYYNEAKDSRRKIKILKEENEKIKQQAIKEFAEKIIENVYWKIQANEPLQFEETVNDLLKEYGIGEE